MVHCWWELLRLPRSPSHSPRVCPSDSRGSGKSKKRGQVCLIHCIRRSTSVQPSQEPHTQCGRRAAVPLMLLFLLPPAGASHRVFRDVRMLPDTSSLDHGTRGALQEQIRLRSGKNNPHPIESRSMGEDKTTEQIFAGKEPSEFVH